MLDSAVGSGKNILILATNNANKILEIREILGDRFGELRSLKESGIDHETVEDGETFLQNAEKKAREIAELSGCPALADDSGLCVDALGGAPGVYSARYGGVHGDDRANNEKLLRELEGSENRRAHYACAMALVWPDGRMISAEGVFCGEIARSPAGNGGFGYDPLFYVPEFNATLACVPPEQKNHVSHRNLALRCLAEKLDALKNQPPIVLGGFMGVGKSAVGRVLAEKLGYDFIDTDDYVEKLAGESIRAMLEQGRVAEVRRFEARAVRQLAVLPRTVISTGGGTPCHSDNMQWILDHGTAVYLDVSLDTILQRAAASHKQRPVLAGLDATQRRDFITAQLAERLPYYRQAHILFPADDPDIDALAGKL